MLRVEKAGSCAGASRLVPLQLMSAHAGQWSEPFSCDQMSLAVNILPTDMPYCKLMVRCGMKAAEACGLSSAVPVTNIAITEAKVMALHKQCNRCALLIRALIAAIVRTLPDSYQAGMANQTAGMSGTQPNSQLNIIEQPFPEAAAVSCCP